MYMYTHMCIYIYIYMYMYMLYVHRGLLGGQRQLPGHREEEKLPPHLQYDIITPVETIYSTTLHYTTLHCSILSNTTI